MALKMSMLPLLVLVSCVNSQPLDFGFGVGVKSQLGAGGSAGGNVGAGVDGGLNGGAKGEAEGHVSWLKSLFGNVYVGNEEGKGIGLGGSVGSDMGALINGTAGIGGDTNIISSHGGAKTGLDADGHYRAGGNVHFLDRGEIALSVANARKFTDTDNTNPIQAVDTEENYVKKPKYSKWVD